MVKSYPLCVVSDRFRLICILIAKNASSTLREEFRKERYAGREALYHSLEAGICDGYFTFAFVRDPVSRLLSAYQEISMRHEMDKTRDPDFPFYSMEDGRQRFAAFLGELARNKWDPHVRTQTDYLDGVRVDFLGQIATFQEDMGFIYQTLDIGPCPTFPLRRSRQERKAVYGYDKYLLDEDLVDETVIELIRSLYTEDEDL